MVPNLSSVFRWTSQTMNDTVTTIRMAINSLPTLQFNMTPLFRIQGNILVVDDRLPLIYSHQGMIGTFDIQVNPKIYGAPNVKEVARWYRLASGDIDGFSDFHRVLRLRRSIGSVTRRTRDLSELQMLRLSANLSQALNQIPGTGYKIDEIEARLRRAKEEILTRASYAGFSKATVDKANQLEDLNSELTLALLAFGAGFDVKLSKSPDLILE